MSAPLIHGIRRFVPASQLVEAIAESLAAIKKEDGLTWDQVGEALGKSPDQAGKYATALAVMDAPTFLRACFHWNGRFANNVFALLGLTLVDSSHASAAEIRQGMIDLMRLLTGLEIALLDGKLDDGELDDLAAHIEQAGRLVDSLRLRLSILRAGNGEARGG